MTLYNIIHVCIFPTSPDWFYYRFLDYLLSISFESESCLDFWFTVSGVFSLVCALPNSSSVTQNPS